MTASVKPLFEDASASDALRELVALARAEGPSEEDLRRLAAHIMLAEGAAQITAPKRGELGSPPPDIALPGGAMLREVRTQPLGRLLGSTLTKVMAALGVTAAIGLGLWGAPHGPVPPALPRAQATPQAALPSALPASLERTAAPAETPEAEPVPEATGAAVGSSEEALASAAPAGLHRVRASMPRSARRPTAGSRAPASELQLIARAEAARANVDQALSLLELHQRLYPDGALAQEREALAIEVLVRAGDAERAKARARRFAAGYPQSAHGPRVRALIARIGSK